MSSDLVEFETFMCNGATKTSNIQNPINPKPYTHTHIYIYIYIYMHTYIDTYIHTYMHAYIHTYIHTYRCLLAFPTSTSEAGTPALRDTGGVALVATPEGRNNLDPSFPNRLQCDATLSHLSTCCSSWKQRPAQRMSG